jgi:hypothetical protein
LNWALITEDNFQDCYEAANDYNEAIDKVTTATETLATAQTALKEVASDGTFT